MLFSLDLNASIYSHLSCGQSVFLVQVLLHKGSLSVQMRNLIFLKIMIYGRVSLLVTVIYWIQMWDRWWWILWGNEPSFLSGDLWREAATRTHISRLTPLDSGCDGTLKSSNTFTLSNNSLFCLLISLKTLLSCVSAQFFVFPVQKNQEGPNTNGNREDDILTGAARHQKCVL